MSGVDQVGSGRRVDNLVAELMQVAQLNDENMQSLRRSEQHMPDKVLLGKAAETPDAPQTTTGQPNVQGARSGPTPAYDQAAAKPSAGKFYAELTTDGAVTPDGNVIPVEGTVTGTDGRAIRVNSKALYEAVNDAPGPIRDQAIRENGVVVDQKTGRAFVPVSSSSSGYTAAPGQADNEAAASVSKYLNRTGDIALLAGASGGFTGLIAGAIARGRINDKAGDVKSGGILSGLGVGTAAAGLSGMGGIGGVASLGTMSTVATVAGFEGMGFFLRKQMKAQVADMKDSTMIGMINNPGIAIEDLIFLFMAHMSEKYEDKLREKMEEAALAEKKERAREAKKDKYRMLGGIASALLPFGAGQAIGGVVEMVGNESIRIHDALDGNTKSSTMLMAEVQMLMHKWKQMNEMLSNLMKMLHDMAMTPIRNIR